MLTGRRRVCLLYQEYIKLPLLQQVPFSLALKSARTHEQFTRVYER
jgi:hypothetical protein